MVGWWIGTLVESKQTASDIKSLFFKIKNWSGHIAGQYCDLRISKLSRTYSIVSGPNEKLVEFGIQLLPKGEFSPLLWNLKIGEKIEISAPAGQHFIWTTKMQEPVVLIGGGSGICPLLSIYEACKHNAIFIESAKTTDKIMYYEKLKDKLITVNGSNIKLDDVDKSANIYICGPTAFVETVTDRLAKLQFTNIKTERFS